MTSPGIRRLTLADLDDATLEQIVRHGEDLLVERKVDLPDPPKFGAAAASLSHTLGGFILLGVADDGTVAGWQKPGKLDLQSYLADVLKKEVDPLPPFIAAMREVAGKPIAVVRVFESADAPHIVRGTGAVYVRTSKGKEPVDDHRTLLALAGRGAHAEEAARARLREIPVIQQAAWTPEQLRPRPTSHYKKVEVLLRAAPLTVTPALSGWTLTRAAAKRLVTVVDELVPAYGLPYGREDAAVEPSGRALAARVVQEEGGGFIRRARAIADASGTFALVTSTHHDGDGVPSPLRVQLLRSDTLLPKLQQMHAVLADAEAVGRVALDIWLSYPTFQGASFSPIHVAGEITVPASADEIEALADAWHREIQRNTGIVKFEGEPS